MFRWITLAFASKGHILSEQSKLESQKPSAINLNYALLLATVNAVQQIKAHFKIIRFALNYKLNVAPVCMCVKNTDISLIDDRNLYTS